MKIQRQSLMVQMEKSRWVGLVATAAYLLCFSLTEAAIYVGSSNDMGSGSGAIYQYSSTGALLATTDPGFAGGSGVLLTVQAGTGDIYASTGGYLQKLSSNLSSREVVGGGFGTFTSIVSLSDGRIVAAASAGNSPFFWWNANGVYSGSYGSGWLDSTMAVGFNDTIFTTYNTGSQFDLGTWSSDFAFGSITENNTGSSLALNQGTGQLWSSGNSSGQVLRFDAAGAFIDVVGNGWTNAIIASSANGTMWLTSSASGGLLASFGSDGSFIAISQTGLGEVAALTVDPTTGEVYVGLTDASGGSINRYASDGTYIDSFGSNLGITSLTATVPEPTTIALMVSALFLSVFRLRRRVI